MNRVPCIPTTIVNLLRCVTFCQLIGLMTNFLTVTHPTINVLQQLSTLKEVVFIESLTQLSRSEDFSPLTQNIKGTKVPTTNQKK